MPVVIPTDVPLVNQDSLKGKKQRIKGAKASLPERRSLENPSQDLEEISFLAEGSSAIWWPFTNTAPLVSQVASINKENT